jgi:hypothetical protein
MAKYKYISNPMLFSDTDPAWTGETPKFFKNYLSPAVQPVSVQAGRVPGQYCQAGAPPAGLEREKHRGYHFDMRASAISIADPPAEGAVMFNFYLITDP